MLRAVALQFDLDLFLQLLSLVWKSFYPIVDNLIDHG